MGVFHPGGDIEFMMEKARRIAHNRTYAGLHFEVGSVAGGYLGEFLANVLAHKMGVIKSPKGNKNYSLVQGDVTVEYVSGSSKSGKSKKSGTQENVPTSAHEIAADLATRVPSIKSKVTIDVATPTGNAADSVLRELGWI